MIDPRNLDPSQLDGGQHSKVEGFKYDEKVESPPPPEGGSDTGGYLEKQTVHELRKIARKNGHTGAKILLLSKEQLIELLKGLQKLEDMNVDKKPEQPEKQESDEPEPQQDEPEPQQDETLDAIIAKRVQPFLDTKTDEKQVQALINKAIRDAGVGNINIKIGDKPEIKFDGEHLHPKFEEALIRVSLLRTGKNLILLPLDKFNSPS